jgi:uncharacterized membrane protein YphA (DoxX/SURF4 family)
LKNYNYNKGVFFMNILVKILTVVVAIIFVASGLQWAVIPSQAGVPLGLVLPEGIGISSMLGDVGGFFMGGGIMVALGLKTKNATWFHATAILAATAAVYRIIAWAAHGAPLAVSFIVIEIVMTIILILASKKLCD